MFARTGGKIPRKLVGPKFWTLRHFRHFLWLIFLRVCLSKDGGFLFRAFFEGSKIVDSDLDSDDISKPAFSEGLVCTSLTSLIESVSKVILN
jgi:hypothetical protein